MLKVGDIVEVVGNHSNGKIAIGEYGIIIEIDERFSNSSLRVANFDNPDGETCWYASSDLKKTSLLSKRVFTQIGEELLKKYGYIVDKKEYAGKFKLGDSVKVNAMIAEEAQHLILSGYNNFGSIGKITKVDVFNKHLYYKVTFDNGEFSMFNEATLELVEQEEQPLSKESQTPQLTIYEQVSGRHNITANELAFILDEFDNGRGKHIIDSLFELRSKWHNK